MLIVCNQLVKYWKISPNGVLHVGAHLAEEREAYLKNNFGDMTWVEANYEKFYELNSRIGSVDLVLHGLVWDQNDVNLNLYLSNNSQASSAMKPAQVKSIYPEIKFDGIENHKSITLDSLLPSSAVFDFVNLDIQGAELNALKGLGQKILKVNYVYTEVYTQQLYEGCTNYLELQTYLANFGFKKVAENINLELGWGDAFFIRIPTNRRFVWRSRILIGSLRYRFAFFCLENLHRFRRTLSHPKLQKIKNYWSAKC